MNGFMDKLAEKIMPLANKLGQNRYLTVLRDAFMLSFPLTMFGSIVVVVNNLPFFNDATKGTLSELFGNGQNATMSIMSVFVTFGIGYYLSESYEVEGIFGGAVSFASFLILTPFVMTLENGEQISGILTLDRLGAKGMFIGMLAAFLAAEIYCRVTKRGWQIKMPDGVPPAVTKSFAALIPAVVTLTVFLIVNAIMTGVFHANLHDVIYEVIQKPLTGLGSSLPATLLALFLVQFLWFFGLHGQIIVNSVMDPIWNTLMLDNLEAYKAGNPLPHIITKPFMETFTVGLGGSGMTLAVVLLMAFVLKKKQYRDVGRLALAPGIFNVNEPAIFGLPIVLNATILIPWVLAPLVVTTLNYLVMAAGIVPPPTGVSVPWTVPIVASGILATNSWLGGALQVLDFIIVGFIWYPFLRILDRQQSYDIE
ncbi:MULTISPECIES: PTS cellobiose transporter subunit IIC [Enterococcus]|uniref:Permease IIC component n=1 Tax=Enterococcus malodoratus ATCC 43197 TaxID=1158601 RepID=R2NTI3_9ENTE|nr:MULTISPECIES: PTS cellobiose transporter subunit IIC [Enterococcus]EOH75342.1 PTS system, lactose/cellobiose family IIC component [Enterococcus malodoratus ATCC 43197]EOT66805.1 PTS system, cellobiose-specific IIC component [Enterococcus malodoratus ATCC 43197]SES71109.1 PTS system, cellobiose-specific IIC component [Enterococcus malodoratus]STD69943.1 PTS system lactose/cellobiose-specific transporter subunit IIC [Enterococcus malodoratus]HCM87401.1 PTS cellobiose transporter subunit IIC [